jgi:hypothetical protein
MLICAGYDWSQKRDHMRSANLSSSLLHMWRAHGQETAAAQYAVQVPGRAGSASKSGDLSQRASEYEVHLGQITQWKKQLLENDERVREQHAQAARSGTL